MRAQIAAYTVFLVYGWNTVGGIIGKIDRLVGPILAGNIIELSADAFVPVDFCGHLVF